MDSSNFLSSGLHNISEDTGSPEIRNIQINPPKKRKTTVLADLNNQLHKKETFDFSVVGSLGRRPTHISKGMTLLDKKSTLLKGATVEVENIDLDQLLLPKQASVDNVINLKIKNVETSLPRFNTVIKRDERHSIATSFNDKARRMDSV